MSAGPTPSKPRAPAPSTSRAGRRYRRLRSLLRSPLAWTGGVVVTAFILVAILAPIAAPQGPYETGTQFLSPGEEGALLGTDAQGRDVFSRMLHGARYSLGVGLLAVTVSVAFGTMLGAVAGFFGGLVDFVLMRVVDLMMAFPNIVLALLIMSVLDRSLTNLALAVGVAGIPTFARQVRASVIAERELEYVMAGNAVGVGAGRLLFLGVLPNCLGPMIVLATLGLASAILDSAGLNFIGLGPEPRIPEWGAMLREFWTGNQSAGIAACTTAIALAVFGFNLLGDALRDALDPRTAKGGRRDAN